MEKHWLDYLMGIGSIATPLLVLVLTAVGWRLRQTVDRRTELENQLREDRIEIYNQILEPFIIILMSDAAWAHNKQNKGREKNNIAIAKMLSLEYRRLAFKLSLVGSDPVVLAYNELMQFFYTYDDDPASSEERLKTTMALLGNFLLAIRRSMGNEFTGLTNWQMLEWFMKDVRKWRTA
jgi:hypothetical protein